MHVAGCDMYVAGYVNVCNMYVMWLLVTYTVCSIRNVIFKLRVRTLKIHQIPLQVHRFKGKEGILLVLNIYCPISYEAHLLKPYKSCWK